MLENFSMHCFVNIYYLVFLQLILLSISVHLRIRKSRTLLRLKRVSVGIISLVSVEHMKLTAEEEAKYYFSKLLLTVRKLSNKQYQLNEWIFESLYNVFSLGMIFAIYSD